MNKKIASEIAIGIIIVTALILGFLFWSKSKVLEEDNALKLGNDIRIEGIITNIHLGCHADGVNTVEIDGKIWVDVGLPCGLQNPDKPRKESYCGEVPKNINKDLIGRNIELYAEKMENTNSPIASDDDEGATICGHEKYFKNYYLRIAEKNDNEIACTQDAKLCSDGSYVSRTAPNCEFAQCPDKKDSKDHTYLNHIMGEKSSIFIDCSMDADCELVDLSQGCRNFSSININNTQEEIKKFNEREKELLDGIVFDCDANSEIKIEEAISICHENKCSFVKK